MVPKFANPHSLSQDVEITTRSEIAERAGCSSFVHDEDNHSLKRDLDTLLRDTWADALAKTPSLSRAKKHRKAVESHKNEDGQLAFRLVSSTKHPQLISLDPKPSAPHVSKEPGCEDDKMQAETRKIRALSVAVEFDSLVEAAVSTRQVDPKPVTVEVKVPLTNTPLARPLPPWLVTEEVRIRKTAAPVEPRGPRAGESPAASPHEPRLSCAVLPVMSVIDQRETPRKTRRKPVRERPPPAYWRPSPELRGKCVGYALGYPSSWAADRLYARDAMKRGVESTWTCHAVQDNARSELT